MMFAFVQYPTGIAFDKLTVAAFKISGFHLYRLVFVFPQYKD